MDYGRPNRQHDTSLYFNWIQSFCDYSERSITLAFKASQVLMFGTSWFSQDEKIIWYFIDPCRKLFHTPCAINLPLMWATGFGSSTELNLFRLVATWIVKCHAILLHKWLFLPTLTRLKVMSPYQYCPLTLPSPFFSTTLNLYIFINKDRIHAEYKIKILKA